MGISITINDAPIKFRPYLDKADKINKGPTQENGIIDTEAEVKSAISAYCSDGHNHCSDIVEYFAANTDYPSKELMPKPDRFPSRFRLYVAPVLSPIGFQHIDFDSLGNTMHVPPHPDDQGAVTKPIFLDPRNSYTIKFALELTLDFWQRVFLNYQYSILEGGLFPSAIDKETLRPGTYNYYGGYPPKNRLRYASGENAYTCIEASPNPNHSHYVTLGLYFPDFYPTNDPGFVEKSYFSIDGGVAIKQFHVIRGWDRFAAVEIMDDKNVNIFGATVGLHVQGFDRHSNPFALGMKSGIRVSYFPGGSLYIAYELTVLFDPTFW